jgi:hypothetical protein
LNHRLHPGQAAGHFTVLVRLEEDHAVLHDPQCGPAIGLPISELLIRWQPKASPSEIAGNVLVAIAQRPSEFLPCRECGSVVPPAVLCPRCGEPVVLQPAAVLGCVSASCPARTWVRLFCPTCDMSLFGVPPFRNTSEKRPATPYG